MVWRWIEIDQLTSCENVFGTSLLSGMAVLFRTKSIIILDVAGCLIDATVLIKSAPPVVLINSAPAA